MMEPAFLCHLHPDRWYHCPLSLLKGKPDVATFDSSSFNPHFSWYLLSEVSQMNLLFLHCSSVLVHHQLLSGQLQQQPSSWFSAVILAPNHPGSARVIILNP